MNSDIARGDDLETAAHFLREARVALDAAMEDARMAALDALANGATEVSVAERLGVTRMTVRKWRGK